IGRGSEGRWALRDRSRLAVGQWSPVPLRRGDRPDAGADATRPAPRHPARATTESTAGLLARGAPPVTAFPGGPSGNVARARPLTVGRAARARELCVRPAFPFRSRGRDGRSPPLNGRHPRLVNADAAFRLRSISRRL